MKQPKILPGSHLLSLDSYGSWLRDPRSLTRKIRNHCHHFSVHLLYQGTGRLMAFETRLLGMSHPKISQVREVWLMAEGSAVVYARSILPRHSLAGRYTPIRTLRQRPLGDTLFSSKSMRRKAVQIFKIHPGHPLYPRNLNLTGPLYARASIFKLNHRPILVTDVFLPGILRLNP
ncbi:MAG: chorismate lyase [Proteobacteria bacterium]|nr:chorismate lyase [Pseudomonadota bacterium]MDE3208098.1 chorismate lyase [Pseudomonadota bacterium]